MEPTKLPKQPVTELPVMIALTPEHILTIHALGDKALLSETLTKEERYDIQNLLTSLDSIVRNKYPTKTAKLVRTSLDRPITEAEVDAEKLAKESGGKK